MIWFTSDTHFGHKNIIDLEPRPFADTEEMDEAIIAAWNTRVAKGDVVYHLGDFAMTGLRKAESMKRVNQLANRLNGSIHLIRGNHDRDDVTKAGCWAWVGDYKTLYIEKQRFILSHYCMRVWWHNYKGSIHLFGHSHGNLDVTGCGKCMDVGCMNFNWAPISVDEVLEKRS